MSILKKLPPSIGFSMEKQIYAKEKIRSTQNSRQSFLDAWRDNNVGLATHHFKMMAKSKRLSEFLPNDYSRLLSSLATMRTPKMAINPVKNVINAMLSQRIALDMRDHHSVLAVYYLAEDYKRVVDHFESMRYYFKLKPDYKCFNYVMESYNELQNHAKVLETFEACVTAWPASQYLNMDGYAILLESVGKQKDLEKVHTLYKTLVDKLSVSKIDIADCIHEALIRSYGHCQQLELAVDLFNRVGASVVPAVNPNFPNYYDAIIEACLECNRPDMAIEYWNHVLDICDDWNVNVLKLKPRSREVEEDWKPFAELPKNPVAKPGYFSPFKSTITRIFAHYYHTKQYHEAAKHWMFCYQSMHVDGESYELAARTFWEMGEKNIAQHILYEMTQKRFTPQTDIYQKIKEYRSLRK